MAALGLFFEFYLIYFFIQQVLISYPFYTYQCIYVNPSLPIHHTALGLSCGTRDLSLQCTGFSLVVVHGLSSCSVQAPECAGSVFAAHGLSSCGMQAPGRVGSVVVVQGLSSCSAGLVAPRHLGS